MAAAALAVAIFASLEQVLELSSLSLLFSCFKYALVLLDGLRSGVHGLI
jgi:hypothetical protein